MDKDAEYIYNGVLLGHKKNEIMSFASTWIDLGIIIPNEVRKRKNFYMISLICGI